MRFALDKNFLIQTMSLTLEVVNNPAIKNLIQSSLESENKDLRLEWIPSSEITEIKSTQIDNVYYANHNGGLDIILIFLGSDEECTPMARIYSLPTHEYNNDDSQFRRYKIWLEERNKWIDRFTKYDDNYYMV